ncbi:DMT family transporter [Tsuneonella sp. HG222]
MSEPAPPHALLRPRVALPFLAIALIWGSTWFVITGQIADVPPAWSVAYRFLIATPAMVALALARGTRMAMPWRVHLLAMLVGFFQFCGNYNLVYPAELHLTSGIVAVMIGLMIVPNAVLGSVVLGQPITLRFALGSVVAIAGILLLLANEARTVRIGGDVALGAWLGIGAMLAASISNIAQANATGRSVPLLALISWSMLYGTVIDIVLAFALHGPPVLPTNGAFWAGTAYLAIMGSVVTFPLYYTLIREIGAGRAAYHNVLVVVIAMVISTLLEGYRWSALAVAGAVLALAGLIVALRAKSV